MASDKKIIWLASYPKSGNTWFRAFLANLLFDRETPIDINQLLFSPIASNRQMFDDTAGISSSDLSYEEIERIRPHVYEELAALADGPIYFKIHDAFTYTTEGIPLISNKVSSKAIYFIRNPLDVAVSFAHHNAASMDKTIKMMNNADYKFCNNTQKLDNQLLQRLSSWSGHVESWLNQDIIPVKIMRYEDMHLNTFSIFKSAVEFLGLHFSDEKIEKAIRFSSFKELQKQEKEKGFKEKPANAGKFFRNGKIGSWHDELTKEQADLIISTHSKIMYQFGYLDNTNKPII
jgi:aryl sulfotransferase